MDQMTKFEDVSAAELRSVEGSGLLGNLVEAVGRLTEGVGAAGGGAVMVLVGQAIYK